MLTPYDRKQQEAERRALAANRDLDKHLLTGTVPATTDWDAELARHFAAPPEGP